MRAQAGGTDQDLLERLRSGDGAAFAALVDHLHARLLRLASSFTTSAALSEDIVQETWLAVIRGLRGFEARSSLRTWIFSILIHRGRTMAAREARRAGSARLPGSTSGTALVEWEPGRGRLGLWEETPVPWALEDPATILVSREALAVASAALAALPPSQRQVVLLRDVEHLSARDVCNILGLSETNERVQLHRGRARIRRALDCYLRDGQRPARLRPEQAPASTGPANARVIALARDASALPEVARKRMIGG